MTANITISIDIPRSRIYDLIVTANETGSGYWARVISETIPEGADLSWMEDPEDAKRWPHHAAALCGGSVTYGEVNEDTGRVGRKRYTLDAAAIARGLAIMATEHAQHFADLMTENDDMYTADVFLQLCLFGDVRYG